VVSDQDRRASLTQRLSRLRPDQITDLLLGLESRIDALRDAAAAVSSPIAIVGMSARFASAASVQDYAALLFSGDSAIRPAPADRPEREGLPPAGYIDGVDAFEAAFFGLRSEEANAMDPQHRLALMLAWHALEDAGYADAARRPRATGIFLGLSTNDYEARFRAGVAGALSPAAILGNARSIAAGRISHWLDVSGPALVVDTACSSSLVAVHAACRALRTGECGMALAGGLNLLLDQDLTDGLVAAGMLSPSHACRTFDAAADGYVRGEGGGLVVLKRLGDAQRDGDRIRAVIRGSAINHDGHASALTAPNRSAQVAVISAALADGRLAPADVQAVECHGTGTPLGDPVEVQALAEVYGRGRSTPLYLGSVKTNIGHLEAAAGIAGLIKTVLALEAGRLPATLNQSQPNPRIAWDRLPVSVIDRPTDWPDVSVRRMAVSSFGFSGTNAHIVLEAAPATGSPEAADRALPLVLPLSAPDQAGLRRLAADLATWLSDHPNVALEAVASALAVGRGRFRERAAILAADRESAIMDLHAIADGADTVAGAIGTAPLDPARIAFLFSGQGSQWAGMAADLYAHDAVFREIVDHGAHRLGPALGTPLTDVMFDPQGQERLTETCHAQPALFVLEYALARRLADFGVRPDIVAGHSLGEWTAACVAGVLSFEDAIDIVAARGQLMGALPQNGAMAAVFAPFARVEPLIARHAPALGLAALNAPDEIVVSGETAAVEALCAELEAAGIGWQRLRTSHAFHSHLMESATAAFAEQVGRIALSAPRLPLVSNVSGKADAAFTDPAYWARQIREPVRFADGLETIAASGATTIVEIGPAPPLLSFAQRAPGFSGVDARFVPTMRRNRPAADALALALCRLYVAGVDIAWPDVVPNGRRASLPGYPFADERHWLGRPKAITGLSETIGTDRMPVAPRPAIAKAARADEIRAAIAASLKRTLQLDDAALASDAGFFTLGVDSLALTEAVATIEKRWKITLPRKEVFEALATPRLLTERVVNAVIAAQGSEAPRAPSPARPAASPAPAAPVPSPQPEATEARGRAFIADFTPRYLARRTASRQQRQTYGHVLADSRAVAGFRTDTKAMLFPIIGARGQGSHIIDADGNDYVDLTMGFGVQFFGHNPPFTLEAISRQLADQGLFLGPQAAKAGEVANRIARLTGNERVAFCNSGTEAVMTALRLARNATGRTLVAMFAGSYHGHFDGTLARPAEGNAAPLAGGTPLGMVEDVLVLDYADPEGSRAALAEVADRLAAVIVEPVQSRRPSLQPMEFLQWLRVFTAEAGIALIFDEVLLGFRVALGGAQAWAGVRADLVTYGKIVGGGLPIGVVAGRSAFLDGIDGGTWPLDGDGGPVAERTFFAGTFNKNPLTMAVATAVLAHLEAEGPALQSTLNARTSYLCRRLNTMLEDEGSSLRVEHFASLFRFTGASDLFYNQLIANGVYVWEGRTCFLSTAHTAADLDAVVEAVRVSARALGSAGLMGTAPRPPEKTAIYPSPGQKALWVLCAFSPESAAAYNQSLVIGFDRLPDEEALRSALGELVARHDSLRMSFSASGEEAFVWRKMRIDLEEVAVADAAAAARWVRAQAAKPFDLTQAPLLRAALVRIGADQADLVLLLPHIATDGWSMQVLADELGHLYSARRAGVAPALAPPGAYATFAEFALKAATDIAAYDHWRKIFETVPAPLALPADRPRPALQTFAGGLVKHRLPPALAADVADRARVLGCSLFTLCLAGYARLLAELSGQDDFAVAIFAAGQSMIGEPRLTGYCISTVPVYIRGGGPDIVEATRSAMTEAMAFPGYPFAAIVKAAGVRRDPSRPPLASVSFNLDRVERLTPFSGLHTEIRANDHGSVRWDLNWNLLSDADGLLIEATFNSGLFDAQRVDTWVARYGAILASLAAGETTSQAHPQPATIASVQSIADHVAAWAVERPDAAAIVDCEGTLSWRALAELSGALAADLKALGIGAGDRVAFCLERGAGPVVAMVAASHLGAAFVPLDMHQPAGHRAVVLEISGARAMVVDDAAVDTGGSVPVLAWKRTAPSASAPPRARVAASDLAYILFTSGSTGQPKGVMVPCGAVQSYARAVLDRLAVPAPAGFGIITSFAADLGYTSVFGAIVSGGTLHAIDAETARDPEALIQWVRRTPIDVLKIVPSHLAALLAAPDAADFLPRRALVSGGDVLTFDLVDRLRALQPSLRVFNHYGPTETTIGCTMIEVTSALARTPDGRVPIGRALDGYVVEVVDGAGALCRPGEIGEIRIGGAGVASGYVGRDPGASSGFRTNPDGSRSYLTGDLGSRSAEGLVTFLGRNDDVVKIRGHRVDPHGVAIVLRGCPGVADAAVLVDHGPKGSARLLAAVVVSETQTVETLARHLEALLPAPQRPSVIAMVDALPLTTNGKIDRMALRTYFGTESATKSALMPADSGTSEPLATILGLWGEVLGQDNIEPHDNFFDRGGDSIMAIQLAGKARACGWLMSPTQIFSHATPATLATVVRPVAGGAKVDREPVGGPVPLTPIQQWFMSIGMADRRRWALTAVFDLPEAVAESTILAALSGVVARHDALRTVFEGDRQQVAVKPWDEALDKAEVSEDVLADRLVARLDHANGPVMVAGLISAGGRRRLVMAVHHLVFDIVSWGIVADDLAAACANPPRAVATPATAWSWWCRAQAASVGGFEDELDYWQAVERRATHRLPIDRPDSVDLEGGAQILEARFSRDTIDALFATLTERFGLQVQESVLALVARPLCRWAGGPIAIELEGHGRAPIDATIDLSRTIGWFTTRYPIALPAEPVDRARDWLLAMKESVRSLPRGSGLGYGLLRYGRGAPLTGRPDVSFNFLGDVGRFGRTGLGLVRLGAGRERDPKAERPHRLAFNAWMEDGALVVRCEFGAGHDAPTLERFMRALSEELAALETVAANSGNLYTPSDFSGIDMSQDELDTLIAGLDL
jgi:amino acid adenylation domain-containing protein/non-ribosomal peptide synthase protein (TIGR01720 family)